jgi:hypothetical protein
MVDRVVPPAMYLLASRYNRADSGVAAEYVVFTSAICELLLSSIVVHRPAEGEASLAPT